MSNPFVTIDDFLSMPVFFWHTVGVDPYKTVTDKIKRWKLRVNYIIQILNLNFILAMELAFLYLSFKNSENFVQACMVMAFVGFVCVGELKIVKVWWQRNHLDALVREMESIFPSPEAEAQDKYQVDLYRKRCRWIMKFLISIFLILITTYNLFDIVQFITHRYVLKVSDARMAMPYTPISPWGLDTKMGFTTMYALQALAGYTCTAGQLSSAILIYGVVMQDIMHFDYLSRTLKGLKLSLATYAEDLKVLQQLIIYHNKLMRITDVINEVFGVTLLLNFLASSILVCMLGFQISIGLSPELVYKMFIYLVAATMETYLLCYFSDSLIVASEGVSWAVYEMNWLETDRRFAKMLILIAVRAQKPVFLKATVFLDISMETMTKFLQVSYRFFCVIRTMYG
ncbi:odorant receptor 67a-like [Drosophila nasuta]|uniref:odorant receptor 67a-like n=1 Tax=Drosophila nasuta TaxID=42062 RepID=UPI00295F1ADE|nr:odorant receptor 67a-like [Drosophila nasuta]